jgi:hypothetical protein
MFATGPALALALGFAVPVNAQNPASGTPNEPATASSAQPGEQTEQWAPGVYDGAKTAVSDTLITLKVKVAILKDQAVSGNDIHISTTDGIVTLMGNVRNIAVMTQAEQIARSTTSVRDVVNQLRVVGSTTDSDIGFSTDSNKMSNQ